IGQWRSRVGQRRATRAYRARSPVPSSLAGPWSLTRTANAWRLTSSPSPLQPDNQAEQQQARNPHPLLGHAIDWRPNAENFLVEFQAGLGSRTAERDTVDQHLAVLFVGHQAYLLQFFLARLAIRNRQQQAELARITNGIFAADAQAQLAVLVYRFQSLDQFRRRDVLERIVHHGRPERRAG